MFGIKGYAILTINPLDSPREIKWTGSYKPSYIDDHIRLKRHVPDKFYNTTANLSYSKTTKSNDTSKRVALVNSGMLKNPAPGAHQINESQTKPSNNCALNYKAPRSSFISEAEAVGRSSVPFYNKNYTLTEKRNTAPQVKTPSNTKYEPSFLKDHTATKLLSPHSYDATGSFFKTQVKSRLISLGKGLGHTLNDKEQRDSKKKPGPGAHDTEKIRNSYKWLTMGASRGWK